MGNNSTTEDKLLNKVLTYGSAAFSILMVGFGVGKWYGSEFESKAETKSQISISNSSDSSPVIQQTTSSLLPLLEQERLKNNSLISINASLIVQRDNAISANNSWVEHDKKQKQDFSTKEQNYVNHMNICNGNYKTYMDISKYEKSNNEINKELKFNSYTLTSEQKVDLKEILKSNDVKILALINQYKKNES
ncbi:hypothetical protein [Acinetobacter vivianii]|uniref:hypothetical protein n=1 Tax=Acinetobacter vivianii TaxID=1776742 RepID=UPI00404175FA